jgi:hypothetical protein
MNVLPFLLIFFGVTMIVAFAIWKPVLFNKQVFVKRINPPGVVKEGDFAFIGTAVQVRMKWMIKTFQLLQVATIKLYYRPDFGNGSDDENCIDLEFEDGTTALLDASIEEHQKVTNDILLALGQSKVEWSAHLPVDSDKAFLYKAPLPLI